MLESWDADGHVEEWEGTFSDQYLDPEFRDRRPTVIDPNGDGFLYWRIEGRAKPFNWSADVNSQAPDRLMWVAVIDYHDLRQAAAEILRCRDLGAVGVMAAGWVGERSIADATFEPIWAAAAETDLAIAVHPCVASTSFGDQQFHFSVLSGFKHVVNSGLLDRHPRLRVGFLETSCLWVPFMVWRAEEELDTIERGRVGINTGQNVPEMRPDEYIRAGRVYFGFEVEDDMLPYVVQRWGPDPWLYASDIPHAHRILDSTGHLLGRTDLDEEAKRKLLVDNTARFYGLPVPARRV